MKKSLLTFLFSGWFVFSFTGGLAQAEEEATDENEDEEVEEEEDAEDSNDEEANEEGLLSIHEEGDELLTLPRLIPDRFTYDSGVEIEYPQDGVRGIFSTAHSIGGENFTEMMDLINSTDLNSMVVDVKDDDGFVTFETDSDSEYSELIEENTHNYISDMDGLMDTFEESEVYPIARIVVFKDSVLAQQEPELSFQENGEVWTNNRGEAFVNPFSRDVWDYNIEVAKEAAKAGFKEIQFDYVRFPEGFETRDETLEYTQGEYADSDHDFVERRLEAVTDFVEYAREELRPYGVQVSVDIFGYAVMEPAPGIGQDFGAISENVDIISSMIYPSHWGPGHFGTEYPDLEPYNLVNEYAKLENELLDSLDETPVSRPWLQDFTASYLPDGQWMSYGKDEVEAQIQGLYDNGIYEFLLWNASNVYSDDVDYMLGEDISIAGADEEAEREEEEAENEEDDEEEENDDEE